MTALSWIKIDMQITNSVVCDASKGCIYKQIKPPLVDEHAFPLTGFVCLVAHVTFGGRGGILIAYNYHDLKPLICC